MTSKVGEWIKIENARCCCHRCGKMVMTSWRYYPEALTYTICYCEPCTEEVIGESLETL